MSLKKTNHSETFNVTALWNIVHDNITIERKDLIGWVNQKQLSAWPRFSMASVIINSVFSGLRFDKDMAIIVVFGIIILRVSFCSDIWYCNILTYYLGNILAYYLDN